MAQNTTVVNYYGERNDARCFYCPNSCSRYGMWAYRMAAADYQDLIDRGWRRLGQYCFKPNNQQTCCPAYTIRCIYPSNSFESLGMKQQQKKCDAAEFNVTKSHKKILKKMSNFLRTGQKCESDSSSCDDSNNSSSSSNSENGEHENSDCDSKGQVQKPSSESADETSASAKIKMITSNPKIPIDIENVLKLIEKVEKDMPTDVDKEHVPTEVESMSLNKKSSSISNMHRADEPAINKSQVDMSDDKKNPNNESHKQGNGADPAKPIQLKAKALRQQRKAEKQMAKGIPSNAGEVAIVKKPPKNTEKTLTAYINEMPTDGKHTLKLNLINIESDEFECIKNTEFELYTRYQTKVHNDPPADMSEFNDFLCKSPIKHEKPEDGPECGYGTFHQQYWLDDTLIAVGVMDIMPRGISSSYFFYDLDLSFLTLGTYGTLREIEFIQQMNKKCPQLRGYYIGFYIPSVPKMLYKGKLQPSYLLCPEKYTWHLLDDDPQAKVNGDFDPNTDLKYLRLLVDDERCLTYNDYKELRCKAIDSANNCDGDFNNFTEYGKVVGKLVSRRSYLVI